MLLDRDTRQIAAKELTQFFSSPIAYLFMASFIAVMLYLFFWVETFFARNIADVRPLFQWMPVILIFLSAALTMRMWSEERRSGTLEFVITSPVRSGHFVLGKFYACLLLLILTLLLTLPVPIMVDMIGELDWGPVLSAYLAAILLGASYLSIGLFVSARTDSQIVSLMLTTLLCALFYLLGSSLLTDFFGYQIGELLRLLGSGSRFESIERGIIDIRDLYYYISITVAFLILNTYSLDKLGWASRSNNRAHGSRKLLTILVVVNVLLVNVWLYPLSQLRVDMTRGKIYSLSQASHDYLQRLQEPMLIRGYFSAKTHPLLSPLVPQIKDLLKEYEVAGKGKVRVEFIDPVQNPEMEQEANKKFGIKPVPLQVTDKYQAALVNSYFNVLVQYGDQHEVLGFRELIEVKATSETDIDVRLRNPEYDLTRTIKKALFAYQSGGNIFSQIKNPVSISAYISADERLPAILKTLKKDVSSLLQETQDKAAGKLAVKFVEPEQGGELTKMLLQQYGFKPMAASLLDKNTFYFYVIMEGNGQVVQIPLPADYKIDQFQRSLQAGFKRFASGFLKTAGIVAPPVNPYLQQMGVNRGDFEKLKQSLLTDLTLKDIDLDKGQVPGDIDILVLLAPKALSTKALFAIDQFVMQGGTVLASTSSVAVEFKDNKLLASKQQSGLEDWLQHMGITLADSLVMDPQNASFPVPVTRNVSGYSFQEVRMLDYPYFIDVREGLSAQTAITSDLGQLTMAWASPIELDAAKNSKRQVTALLSSSASAWASASMDVMPRISEQGVDPFPLTGTPDTHLLGVVIEGQFSSFFKDKSSPLQQMNDEKESNDDKEKTPAFTSVISHSPDSARIILFSSNEFLKDQVNSLLTSAQGSSYLNAFQLMANTIDWTLEDRGLLKIRSRGHFNRTLPPLERGKQLLLEYSNYGIALLAVILIAAGRRLITGRKKRRYRSLLAKGHANV